MDRQEQAGRQGAQLGDPAATGFGADAADPAEAAFWRRAAIGCVLALTALRLVFLALSPLELDFEEAQYWFWAQAPGWGYFSKPPLIAWLIAASTALLGDGEFGVRALSPVLHGATALCLGGLGRRLAGPRTGFCAGLAYATLPGVSFSALLMTTDVPVALAWSVALYALLRIGDRDGFLWAAIGGVAAGLGLLAKYVMAFFLPGALLALILMPEWRRRVPPSRLALFAALALLLLLPNLLWNFSHGDVTLRQPFELAGSGGLHMGGRELAAFLGGQLALAGPLFVAMVVAVVAGVRAIGRPASDPDRRLLWLGCFAAPLFLVYLPMALLTRVNANWPAMAYPTATVAAVLFALARGRRWLKPLLAIQSGLAVLGPALVVAAPMLRFEPAARLLDRVSGWREFGRVVAERLAAAPERRILFFDPATAKWLIYYARIERGRFAMWNPDLRPDSELERIASLVPGEPGDWLIVDSELPFRPILQLYFDSLGARNRISETLPSGGVRLLKFQEAGGFKDYAP